MKTLIILLLLSLHVSVSSQESLSAADEKGSSLQKTSEHKFGPIIVKQLQNRDRWKAYSVKTKHYDLYIEGDKLDPEETGKILEAAWYVKKEFFQASPPEDKPLIVKFYADLRGFHQALRNDNLGRINGGGYYWEGNGKAYLWWQPAGIEFSRYLLLHEAAHQFEHLCGKKVRYSKFWTEGVADYLALHHWNGNSIKLGSTMNSNILKKRAETALKTYGNCKNDFRDILMREKYSYQEAWGIVHFLMSENKEKGRQLFNNMLKSSSLKEAWKRTFDSEDLDSDFKEKLTSWLEKMALCPKNVFFVSWGDLWFGWEKALELKDLLEEKTPESLKTLIKKMDKMSTASEKKEKVKDAFKKAAPEVMMDILTGNVPDYRYQFAFASLAADKDEIESLKLFCYKQALAEYKKGDLAKAYKISKGLIKVSWMKADKLIDQFKKLKEEEKKKAVALLKEKKYYEAFRIYTALSKIFHIDEAPVIYAFLEKLKKAPNSSKDIKQAEAYLKIYKNARNRSYSRTKLKKACNEFLIEWPESRFTEKVKAIR